MPIYEYFSPDTQKVYAFYAPGVSYADRVPRCPDDPKAAMQKAVSGFSVTGFERKAKGESGEDMDDPQMEAAMMEVERAMAGMDEENPDPRQLGQVMRQMTHMMGPDKDPAMMEMIERLEHGDDPDKLEEEYGDALENMVDPESGLEENATASTPAELLRTLRRQPRRDPALYDIRDYLL